MKIAKNTLVVGALLIGLGGFSVGYNYQRLSSDWGSSGQSGLPEDLDYSSLEEIYDTLRKDFAGKLDAKTLLDGAKNGLVEAAGDPYTDYLDESAAAEFEESLEGKFSGIGAEIAIKNERLVISAPLKGTPAEGAGLKAGDHIQQINGKSTEGWSIEAAVKEIRGPAGTNVALVIARGKTEPREYKLTRQQITIPSVATELKGSVGVIALSRFGSDTATEFRKQAQQLLAEGAKSLVLDVRNNPGGILSVAAEISNEFLAPGKVIVEERRDGQVLETYRARRGGILQGMPVVVLINEGSASASEIIAGALKDNGVAKLVGKQSFGKGSVQTLVDLKGRTQLKLTVAKWYTPSGRNISEEGIAPDYSVDLTEADWNKDRDPQLAKALELLR